jgi:hypothetical protein
MGGINGLPSMAPLGSAIVPSYLAYLRVESEVHTKTKVKAARAVFGGREGIRKGQMVMDVKEARTPGEIFILPEHRKFGL